METEKKGTGKIERKRINLKNNKGQTLEHSYALRYNIDDFYNNDVVRFFGYARVSSEQQRENGSSVECQINYIEEECRNKGYSLLTIYVDDGISGCYLKDRYGYDCMIKNIQNNLHKIAPNTLGIMVTSLNRINRNIKDNENFFEFIAENELQICMLDNPKADPSDPNTKLYLRFKALVNTHDAENIRHNTTIAMRKLVEEGKLEGRAPYGTDKKGNPVPIEQEGLKYIYKFHDEGKGNYEILELMNKGFPDENNNEIKIPYNNFEGRRKPRDGDESKIGVWTKAAIKTIIEKYECSKRTVESKISVRYKDKTIKEKARKIKDENPDISYTEIAERINDMAIFNCIIKPDYVHNLIKSTGEEQGKQEYIFSTYQKILELQKQGISSNSTLSTKLNKLKIKPPGRGVKWYHTTVESFIKKCEETPPVDVTLNEGLIEDNEEYNIKEPTQTHIKTEEDIRKEVEEKLREKIEKEMREKIEEEYRKKSTTEAKPIKSRFT